MIGNGSGVGNRNGNRIGNRIGIGLSLGLRLRLGLEMGLRLGMGYVWAWFLGMGLAWDIRQNPPGNSSFFFRATSGSVHGLVCGGFYSKPREGLPRTLFFKLSHARAAERFLVECALPFSMRGASSVRGTR